MVNCLLVFFFFSKSFNTCIRGRRWEIGRGRNYWVLFCRTHNSVNCLECHDLDIIDSGPFFFNKFVE